MHVLIAEDDLVSRKILQRSVERLGHQCLLAANGEEALALHEAHHPDVVISDWVMPKLDGLSLCKRLRADKDATYTYFVLLTSRSDKAHRLEGVQAGADDYLTKPLDVDELKLRLIAATRVTSLHRELRERARQIEQLNQDLYKDGRRDALTGIANRRAMEEDLERLHSQMSRHGHGWAIALIDIDKFKSYNDTCGHPAGDEALRRVARCLSGVCRAHDSVYRYGGEEFLAVFPHQDIDGALQAAERMRSAVQQLGMPNPGLDPVGPMTISVGVSVCTDGTPSEVSVLIEQADRALYEAKQAGRNKVRHHLPQASAA